MYDTMFRYYTKGFQLILFKLIGKHAKVRPFVKVIQLFPTNPI